MNHKLNILAIPLLFGLGVSLVWGGVTTPGTERERTRQIREYYEQQRRLLEQRQQEEDEEDIIDETVKPDEKRLDGEDISFEVNKILTTPSDILSETELREILAPLEGRVITLRDLFDAVEAINNLYKDKNQIAARAILPPQKITEGTVTIKLIEGRVGAIKLEDNKSTKDEYITKRLSAKPGDLVEITQLEQDLFYFNTINDISLRGVLKPGETAGTTDYVIQAIEPPRYEVYPFIDNAGTKDVGRERIGLNYTNRSLMGYRDQFTFGLNIAEGTRAGYASYSIPVNTLGTRLGLSFDKSDIEIVNGPLELLNIDGDSTTLGVNVTHPLIVSKALFLNGFADFSFKESTTDFDDVTLFKATVRPFSFGFDAQFGDQSDSWYTRNYFTLTDENWGNVQGFTKFNTDVSWMHVFSNRHFFTMRGRGQWSDVDLLPAIEQFLIGGVATVRGYREGLLVGDDGYFISLEYNFTLPLNDLQKENNFSGGQWRGFVFLDHGGVFPFKGDDEGVDKDDFLTSVGLGLNIDLGKKFQSRLALGIPLLQRDDGLDDPRILFYIQSNPF